MPDLSLIPTKIALISVEIENCINSKWTASTLNFSREGSWSPCPSRPVRLWPRTPYVMKWNWFLADPAWVLCANTFHIPDIDDSGPCQLWFWHFHLFPCYVCIWYLCNMAQRNCTLFPDDPHSCVSDKVKGLHISDF